MLEKTVANFGELLNDHTKEDAHRFEQMAKNVFETYSKINDKLIVLIESVQGRDNLVSHRFLDVEKRVTKMEDDVEKGDNRRFSTKQKSVFAAVTFFSSILGAFLMKILDKLHTFK